MLMLDVKLHFGVWQAGVCSSVVLTLISQHLSAKQIKSIFFYETHALHAVGCDKYHPVVSG